MFKITGLKTALAEFDRPDGGLAIAKNINIPRPNLATPRRGFDRLSSGYSDTADRTLLLTEFKDKIFALTTDTGGVSNHYVAYTFSGSVWTRLGGVYNDLNDYFTTQASGNLYITSDWGVQRFEDRSDLGSQVAAPRAGVPQGLAPYTITDSSSGPFANNESVAYRIVWAYQDANENLIVGAPSDRRIYKNTSGGAAKTVLTIPLPDEITTDYVIQIYRSPITTAEVPSDEMQLVDSFSPTSSDVSTGSLSYTDDSPDTELGATIYTAPSQEGLAASNLRPPICKDIAVYDNCLFFLNTTQPYRRTITLKAASALSDGDTLTIGAGVTSFTLTARTSPSTSDEFAIESGGDADDNTRDTAQNFVDALNRYSSGWQAQYLGSDDNSVGLGDILITDKTDPISTFYIRASVSDVWLPPDLPTSGTSFTATREQRPNGLAWSKPNQPESVPLTNRAFVGSKDSDGQRIVALEEGLMIFKEDGLYRLSGTYPNFTIELVDATVRLLGNQTPQVLGNAIYCLTTQGVCRISAYDVQVISTDIEDQLFDIIDSHASDVDTLAWGLAHEYRRLYYLFYPLSSNDSTATQALVYNTYTRTWVTHTLAGRCGLSDQQDLYIDDPDSNFVLQERNSGTNRDYADYGFAVTITNTSNRTITLDSNVDNISAGDILFESTTVYSPITAVDPIASTVTVASNPGFTNTSVTIQTAIETQIEWLPTAMGNEALVKQIHTTTPLFKRGFTGTLTIDYSTDLSPATVSASIEGPSVLGWGLGPWGQTPWGDEPVKKPIRQWVPRAAQRCTWLIIGIRHTYGYSDWELQGLKVYGNLGDEKAGR